MQKRYLNGILPSTANLRTIFESLTLIKQRVKSSAYQLIGTLICLMKWPFVSNLSMSQVLFVGMSFGSSIETDEILLAKEVLVFCVV